jgi:hypothetical protein
MSEILQMIVWTFCRQIYSSTVSPTAKDVVIVLDRSGSMATLHGSKTLLQTAIDAVSAVLDTLSVNDRVSQFPLTPYGEKKLI